MPPLMRRSAIDTLPPRLRMQQLRSGTHGWLPLFRHIIRYIIIIRRLAREMFRRAFRNPPPGRRRPEWMRLNYVDEGFGAIGPFDPPRPLRPPSHDAWWDQWWLDYH